MAKDPQSRKYLLTINNPKPKYTHENIIKIVSINFRTFRYLAMADEIGGEKKTYHTHVFFCFDSAVRCSKVKKHFPEAHIDIVKGSVQDNINYIKKQGKWADTKKAETTVPGTFEEKGTRPPENAGKNILYEKLYRMIVEEELSNMEIIQINQDYLPMIDTMTRLRTAHLQEKFRGTRRMVEVTYVQGVTGAGKSRGILDEYGDENVYRVTDYLHPFDSYSIQDVLVFEEFRSSLKISDMLNYLDIYPLELPARYAQKQACYTKVFIVTNLPLEQQYPEIQRENKETWEAFLRRIKKVREYTDIGKYTDYNSTAEYFKSRNSFRNAKEGELPSEWGEKHG